MKPTVAGRNPFFSLTSIVIVGALVLVLASVALATWPTADDYCNRVLVDEHGVGGALRWLFDRWSGRLVTSTLLYAAFASIDLPSLRWVSLAVCVLFAIAAYLMSMLVAPNDRGLRWPLCALVLASLVLGLYRILGQTVFWMTGGIVYMVPLVLTLLWLVGVRRIFLRQPPRGANVAGFALGIVVGNSIELVLPIIGVYVLSMAAQRWRTLTVEARHAIAARVAGVVVGALVLVSAPGNYARAKVTPDSFRIDPAYLAGEYARMLSEIASRAWPMVAIVVVLAALSIVGAMVHRRHATTDSRPSPWLESFAFAFGSFASIAPVLAAPIQFAPRNGLYVFVFLLVAALIPFVASIEHTRRRTPAIATIVAGAAAAAIYASMPLVDDAQASAEFRDRQMARDLALRQLPHAENVDAVVDPFGLSVPRTLHFIELDADRTQWNNVCTAKYYGLRSIALAPKPK